MTRTVTIIGIYRRVRGTGSRQDTPCQGTGRTPFVSIRRQYARIGNGEAHLVFGERTAGSIIHRSTLAKR